MALPVVVGALITGAVTTIFYGWVAGLIMAGLTLLMGLISPVPKIKLKPASLSDFKITQADEGQPIPLVYGIVKIPGNIIYYGNLKTKKVEQAGGKGGGKKVTTGYKYWIDMWQAICIGKVELIKAILNDDEEKTPSYKTQIFNDGTRNAYPTHLEYASRLPNIAHIYWSEFYVGENITVVPTVYFWVKRILQTGLPYENMDSGSNPAAVVFDLLVNWGGVSSANLNMTSFQNAANYFYQQGYAINYVISSTKKIRDVVNDILSFVDSYLDYDENGKIVIKIMKKTDTSIGTIEDDFIEFTFSKPSWNTIPNHFVANFVEDGKERTLILENQAAKLYAGQIIREEFDLTVFKERSIALKRLADIMKRDSYPRIALSLRLPLKYAIYSVGDVVTVRNSEIGITADFRIVSTSEPKLEDNEIEMQLIQHTDLKFDDYYQNVGGNLWQKPDYTLQKLTKVKIIELDYVPQMANTTNFLVIASRETGFEEEFIVLVSLDGISYEQVAICSDWFTAGTIVDAYPNTTYDIDDDVGIIFRPYKQLEQIPLNIPRQSLFVEPRILVVNDEIMAFQNYSPYGATDYRITGIVRNVLWSGKANHNANSPAFHGYIGDNIINLELTTTFYVKVIPVFQGQIGDVAQATAIQVTPTTKAKSPRPPERIYAVRSGSTVTVDVFVINKTLNTGQGMQNADQYTDTYPFPLEGRLYISTDDINWEWKDTANFTITNASAFTLRVKHYYNGRFSTEKTLSIGTADGEYVS